VIEEEVSHEKDPTTLLTSDIVEVTKDFEHSTSGGLGGRGKRT
jgi:hypothetical protein